MTFCKINYNLIYLYFSQNVSGFQTKPAIKKIHDQLNIFNFSMEKLWLSLLNLDLKKKRWQQDNF